MYSDRVRMYANVPSEMRQMQQYKIKQKSIYLVCTTAYQYKTLNYILEKYVLLASSTYFHLEVSTWYILSTYFKFGVKYVPSTYSKKKARTSTKMRRIVHTRTSLFKLVQYHSIQCTKYKPAHTLYILGIYLVLSYTRHRTISLIYIVCPGIHQTVITGRYIPLACKSSASMSYTCFYLDHDLYLVFNWCRSGIVPIGKYVVVFNRHNPSKCHDLSGQLLLWC